MKIETFHGLYTTPPYLSLLNWFQCEGCHLTLLTSHFVYFHFVYSHFQIQIIHVVDHFLGILYKLATTVAKHRKKSSEDYFTRFVKTIMKMESRLRGSRQNGK